MTEKQIDFYQNRLTYAQHLLETDPAYYKIYMAQFTEKERGQLESDLRKFSKKT